MKREDLIPGENCDWYNTGPVDEEYLCAYHAWGCSVVEPEDNVPTPAQCMECRTHMDWCTGIKGGTNGCPSRHQDACDRHFKASGYEADVGSGWHCQCKCHASYPMNTNYRD
jgi:hypothetical protein